MSIDPKTKARLLNQVIKKANPPGLSSIGRLGRNYSEIGRLLFPVQKFPEPSLLLYTYKKSDWDDEDPDQAPPGLPIGTRVRVHPSGCSIPGPPAPIMTGTILKEKPENGGYLVEHDGHLPGPFGWTYYELEALVGNLVSDEISLPWE